MTPKWVREHDKMIKETQARWRAAYNLFWREKLWEKYFEYEKEHPELKQRRVDYAVAHPEWVEGREQYVFRD